MPHAPGFPKLSGCVHVATDTPQRRQRFAAEIALLSSFGWRITPPDSGPRDAPDMQVVPLGECDAPNDIPTLIRCDRAHPDAIEPDGFAMLSALGGGQIERDLAASVTTDALVDKVLIGLNWSMVQAGPYCGIARSPERGTEGPRSVRPDSGFTGRPLQELAGMMCSTDALARSLGLAAINAFWNRVGQQGDKTGFARFDPPGEGLVIIGGFRDAQKRLPQARIVEREPQGNDIAVADAAQAIAGAQALVITAQTLMNGSLEPLLRSSGQVPFRMLLGPSAPVCPLLLEYGLNDVSGTAVSDWAATEQFILETGTNLMRPDLTCNIGVCR